MDEPDNTVVGKVQPLAKANAKHHAFLASLSVDLQDLSSDKLLAVAPQATIAHLNVPAIGGIPLFARIGKGGMGAVYYGIHPRLKKEVAVKIMTIDATESPESVDHFFREAQIAANLQSPNLISVLDVNEENNLFFIVMEYVSGMSAGAFVRRVIQDGKPGLDELTALEICIAATDGLAAAHEAGIVHRDIKPDNIMVPYDKAGRMVLSKSKLADLGLARTQSGHSTQGLSADSVCGTLGFMSPEQTRGARFTKKPSDVFSMGATLYALLTGCAPFGGDSPVSIILSTVQSFPKPITKYRSDISAETLALIDRCLAKRDADRPADAAELAAELRECRAILAKPTRNSAVIERTVVNIPVKPKPDLDSDTILKTFKYTTHPTARKVAAIIPETVRGQPNGQAAAKAAIPARMAALPAKRPTQKAPQKGSAGMLSLAALVLVALGVMGYFVFGGKKEESGAKPPLVALTTTVPFLSTAVSTTIEPKTTPNVPAPVQITLPAAAQPSTGEVLVNEGFENFDLKHLPNDFGTYGLEFMSIVELPGHGKVLRIDTDSDVTRSVQLRFHPSVEKMRGRTLKISVMAYCPKGNSGGFAGLTAAGDAPLPKSETNELKANENDWKLCSLTVHVPTDARHVEIQSGIVHCAGEFFFDDLRVEILPDAPTVATDPPGKNLAGFDQAAFNAEVAKLPPAEQVKKVMARLMELNPGFDGANTFEEYGGHVDSLKFSTLLVRDISPVDALHQLSKLSMSNDWLMNHKYGILRDLSPIRNLFHLEDLDLNANKIERFDPLVNLKLKKFQCAGADVNAAQLDFLQKMPLRGLILGGANNIESIESLKDLPLDYLDLSSCPKIVDIRALANREVAELHIEHTGIIDLSPLKTMPKLQKLTCDYVPDRDYEILKSVKTLQTVNGKPIAELETPGAKLTMTDAKIDDPARWKNAIDLMPLIDVAKDSVDTPWTRNPDGFRSPEPGGGILEIPFSPPAEYDYSIEFTRHGKGKNGVVAQHLSKSGKSFCWVMSGTTHVASGFSRIDGKEYRDNQSSILGIAVESEMRYRSTVQVRNKEIRVYLDGKLICTWKTETANMSSDEKFKLRDPNLLGIGFWYGGEWIQGVVHSAKIIEISGKGAFTRPDDPAAKEAEKKRSAVPAVEQRKGAAQ